MSILRYLKNSGDNLPKDREFEAVNKEVAEVESPSRSKKRGAYGTYSPKQRYEIGKYAAENSPSAASKKYSPLLNRKLNESTCRGFKSAYLSSISKTKRKLIECDDTGSSDSDELHTKKRGRRLLLGEELDDKVQRFINSIRKSGGIVNTAIVKAAGRGVVLSKDRTLLVENGGHIDITRDWALSVMTRMDLVKRKGTTSKKVVHVENFTAEKEKYLDKIRNKVDVYSVPSSLIINWDQTGLHIVPVSQWTMAVEGSKRVEIAGSEDKRQITATFAGALDGSFLPIQLIYQGKTQQCHPKYKFPEGFHITHSENHWANASTMDAYIDEIIVPYVNKVKEEEDLPLAQRALVIFDCFRGQITDEFKEKLNSKRLVFVTIPPNCTDLLQPMDLSVNKSAKHFLKSEFEAWYAGQVCEKLSDDGQNVEEVKVDMSLGVMKPLGAKWITKLYDYLSGKPEIITNGFKEAGIFDALNE